MSDDTVVPADLTTAGFTPELLNWGPAPSEVRQKEAELCTCGLVAVGYRASWALRHLDSCPAQALFNG